MQLQNVNVLFHCLIMTCNVMGYSLCPQSLFLQARSHIVYQDCIDMKHIDILCIVAMHRGLQIIGLVVNL